MVADVRLRARGVALASRLAPTDLDLAPGSVTVLVGPNGSGKTSLLHALARIGAPAGEVRVDGRSLDGIAPRGRPEVLGYAPAARELVWPLTVRDFIRLTAPNAGVDEIGGTLDALELSAVAGRRVDTLSTGERSRVLLARAMLPRPPVLLLDEPFANLDPLWQLRLAARLRTEAARGAAILVSAHDLALAARLSLRMLVVERGRIVADDVLETLLANGTIGDVFGVARAADGGWREAR